MVVIPGWSVSEVLLPLVKFINLQDTASDWVVITQTSLNKIILLLKLGVFILHCLIQPEVISPTELCYQPYPCNHHTYRNYQLPICLLTHRGSLPMGPFLLSHLHPFRHSKGPFSHTFVAYSHKLTFHDIHIFLSK